MTGDRHLCHHPNCDKPVPEAMFACRNHWYALPRPLRDRIWQEYVPGQEKSKTPSRAYLDAALDCVRWWDANSPA